MNVTEFEDCLDRFGSDLSDWPGREREAGQALLAHSTEARYLLAESALLADALSTPAIRAPAGLADRIVLQAVKSKPITRPVVAVEKPTMWARLEDIFPLALRPSSALVLPAVFALGLLVGFFSSSEHVEETHLDLPSYVAHVVDTAHDAD
jgi:hypothetical protein